MEIARNRVKENEIERHRTRVCYVQEPNLFRFCSTRGSEPAIVFI